MSSVLQRRCTWCRTTAEVPRNTHCDTCGGPLPTFPRHVLRQHPDLRDDDAGLRATRPGPAPRALPRGYALRTLFWHFMFGFGSIFIAVGAVSCAVGAVLAIVALPMILFGLAMGAIFGGIGALAAGLSVGARWRQLQALRTGSVARGTVQGTRPYSEEQTTVYYTFDGPAGPVRGLITTADPVTRSAQADDVLWVVFAPHRPGSNTVWPPR